MHPFHVIAGDKDFPPGLVNSLPDAALFLQSRTPKFINAIEVDIAMPADFLNDVENFPNPLFRQLQGLGRFGNPLPQIGFRAGEKQRTVR
ncbi:MAG: hypothetical protein BWY31_04766 [Lentisphaerae bacterium ADurb.Bin242]|nr:MAG: hypothetical protein BWY31_04766 [Lentisphaerae bacterium ADurb.Bin242]